jgi:cytochrome c biogenesis protein CcdA/peroxiredoxin
VEAENLSIGLAFLAGFVSFISPCVLPLVPAYIGYMGGRATKEAGKEDRQQFGTFVHGIFFVLGFTAFFVGFGLLTSAASSFLNSIGIDIPTLLTRLGGVAVIFFGLYVMKLLDPIFARALRVTGEWRDNNQFAYALGFTISMLLLILQYFYWAFGGEGVVLRWFAEDGFTPFVWSLVLLLGVLALLRGPMNEARGLADFWHRAITSLQVALISDTRKQSSLMTGEKHGYGTSFSLGIVFSAGWTPCVGPIYAGVLALAADASTTGSLVNAGVLLTAYSLGLGIPFLLTALAFNQSTSIMTSLKRNMRKVELVSGSLLLFIGVLILSGGLTDLSNRFATNDEFIEFSTRMEECTVSVFDGRISAGSYTGCLSSGEEKLGDLFVASVRFRGNDTPFVFAPAPDNVEVGLNVGNRAPNFTLTTLEGETVSLEDFRGEAVLLNFWATWCTPCRAEMPIFDNVYASERDRGFTILAVNLEESPEQIDGFVEEIGGLSFPILLDRDGSVNREYRVRNYPTSLLLDGNGIIQTIHRGAVAEEDLREDLEIFEPESVAEDTTVQALP